MPVTRASVVLAILAVSSVLAVVQAQRPRPAPGRRAFSVVEATIPDMQAAMKEGRVTSRELVRQYLARIAMYEHTLHAALAISAEALNEADQRDRERAQGRVRGPLHGIPVALKDNIQTTSMPTTGGALAFERFVPRDEATLARNLREAGAVIIAKTGMTELANWVAGDPTPMPTNYNAVGGFGFNPYDPRRDPRDSSFDGRPALATGGSSSGIGTAASFWAANVGTETSGSILSPSNQNMLAGIKPTVGRISRYGVIPITADQDTPGPMARTVTDGNAGQARIPGKHGATPTTYATVIVVVPDEPGALGRLLRDVGDAGVNMEDLHLEHGVGQPFGLAELSVLPAAVEPLVAALSSLGWPVHD